MKCKCFSKCGLVVVYEATCMVFVYLRLHWVIPFPMLSIIVNRISYPEIGNTSSYRITFANTSWIIIYIKSIFNLLHPVNGNTLLLDIIKFYHLDAPKCLFHTIVKQTIFRMDFIIFNKLFKFVSSFLTCVCPVSTLGHKTHTASRFLQPSSTASQQFLECCSSIVALNYQDF